MMSDIWAGYSVCSSARTTLYVAKKRKEKNLFLLSCSSFQFLGFKGRFELLHPGPFGCLPAQRRPNLQVFVLLWCKSPLILHSVFLLQLCSENSQVSIKIFPLFIASCCTPVLMLSVIQQLEFQFKGINMMISSSFQKEETLEGWEKNSLFLLNNGYPALYSNVSTQQMKTSEIQEKLAGHKCSRLPAVVQLMNISTAFNECYKTT